MKPPLDPAAPALTTVAVKARVPEPGAFTEVAPGFLWTQFKLPFALNHVNVYLIEDAGGWAVFDTGIGDERTRECWRQLMNGPLRGERLTRLIVSHFHPDHVGAGRWLIDEFGLGLHMNRSEYLYNLLLHARDTSVLDTYKSFYMRRGLSEEKTDSIVAAGHDYVHRTEPLPPVYHALADGERLRIGKRDFEIMTGGGHSWDQVMLYARQDNVLIVADQVLPGISPNVSVVALEPENDPLATYLHSIRRLARKVDKGVLALPGHRKPFHGLHDRIAELTHHHDLRCGDIARACAERPMTPAELVPVLFFEGMDAQQTSFAFCEIIAHLNYMEKRGEIVRSERSGQLAYLRPAR